jgi:hypothetical protein
VGDDSWEDIFLGPLPIESIKRCLGLDLKPGNVVFHVHAQEHAFGKVRERHELCVPHLQRAVSAPTYIGQQPGYEAKGIDLSCQTDEGHIVLVGISLLASRGIYPLMSTYPLPANTLRRRLRVGTTFVI